MAGSPQSTLGGIGSWSGRSAVSSNGSSNGPSQVPSPPTTPFGASNDALDVIYAAAGQVARLKMSGESPKNSYQSRGLLAPPMSTTPVSTEKSCYFGLYSNQSVAHNLPQVTQVSYVLVLQSSYEAGVLRKILIVAVLVFVVGLVFVVSTCKAGPGAETTARSFNLGEARPNEVVLVS